MIKRYLWKEDIDKPILQVRVSWPGASPDDLEREIITRLERSISSSCKSCASFDILLIGSIFFEVFSSIGEIVFFLIDAIKYLFTGKKINKISFHQDLNKLEVILVLK